LDDTPFRYIIGQENPEEGIYWAEFLDDQNHTLVETAPTLTIVHRLFRAAAYDRDVYHHRLRHALDFIEEHIGAHLAPPSLLEGFGRFPRAHGEGRIFHLQFPIIRERRYVSRHSEVMAIPGTLVGPRAPRPGENPDRFRAPVPIPPGFGEYLNDTP
jgi:hypothetical protein